MINYELGFLIAIFAFVYCVILTDVEMILNPVYNWLDNKTTNKGTGKKHWLFKMLMHCEKCFAGQVAFWLFIYERKSVYLNDIFINVVHHLFFVTYTILLALSLNIIYKQTQKTQNGSNED